MSETINDLSSNSSYNKNTSGTTMIPDYGAHVPEDKDQYLVRTPYGPGLVIRTRKTKLGTSGINGSSSGDKSKNHVTSDVVIREIELTGWLNTGSNTVIGSNSEIVDSTDHKNPNSNSSNNQNTNDGRPIRPAILYTSIDYPSIIPHVGSDVMCPYGFGRGRVIEIRNPYDRSKTTQETTITDDTDSNNKNSVTGSEAAKTLSNSSTALTCMVVVRLSTWRLANRNTVLCYWDINTVRTVRHKHIYEMSIIEKIEYANELKQIAATHFHHKEYWKAIVHYERAVNAVKYVQHNTDSTNMVRADLLMVMITCCNNSATCYTQLVQQQQQQQQQQQDHSANNKKKHEYHEKAYQHAQQALSLIEALESKKGGRIHQELLNMDPCNDLRIFGEWKVKSLYIIANISYVKYDRIEDAIATIHKARGVISNNVLTDKNMANKVDPTITSNTTPEQQVAKIQVQLGKKDRELIKLYHQCKERQKELLKIEKLRAQAMFAVPNDTPMAGGDTSSSRTSTPIASNVSASTDTNEVSSPTTTAPPHDSNRYVHSNEHVDDEKESDGIIPSTFGNGRTNSDDEHNQVDSNADKTMSTGTDIPWHHDPYVLTGLGFVIGTIGTVLILSQLWMLPTTPIKR
jgi:tetratricopeptide (TPR) repeat protein